MIQRPRLAVLALLLSLVACAVGQPPIATPTGGDRAEAANEPPIRLAVVQINDVYEISPLDGGRIGGMARLGTILRQLRDNVPHVVAVLAGDFLGPSLISGLARIEEGERVPIAGEQMVAVLNAVGIDYATFGNHELDFPESSLRERIDESEFLWISANVRRRGDSSRPARRFEQRGAPIPDYRVHTFSTADGGQLDMGIFAVTLPFNLADYVEYEDVFDAAARASAAAAAESDFVVALTHLSLAEDRELARRISRLPLIFGGHEHEHISTEEGATTIVKADANARTVFVHWLTWDPNRRELDHWSQLVPITDDIAEDPEVQALVDEWEATGDALIERLGYTPHEVVADFETPRDGRELSVRTAQTDLGQLIACAMRSADPIDSQLAVLNGGSIRIDDWIVGQLQQKDVLRILPFGGSIVHGRIRGAELERLLVAGLETNVGLGGFLQTTPNLRRTADGILLDERPLDAERVYEITLPTFLARGLEENLEFLSSAASYSELTQIPGAGGTPNNDLRDILIVFLREGGTCPEW